MQVFAVARDGFDRVADGVAEIQDRPQAALGFVLAHHFGLDLAATRDDRGQHSWVAAQEAGQFALETPEELGVVNDAVLDDLGRGPPDIRAGQGASVRRSQSTSRG